MVDAWDLCSHSRVVVAKQRRPICGEAGSGHSHDIFDCRVQVASMPPAVTEHAMLCRQALTDITARVLSRKK